MQKHPLGFSASGLFLPERRGPRFCEKRQAVPNNEG